MASSLRVPKLGKSKSKALTVFVFANVFLGYVVGFTRTLPDYLAFASSLYILAAVPWGFLAAEVKGLRAPPLFPKTDHPPGQEPMRPEDDDLVEDDALPGA
jgi:hypothetical protein